MRNAILYCILLLSYTASSQTTPADTAFFNNYFSRLSYNREFFRPETYDSLEIVNNIAVKKNFISAICRYHIEKAAWFVSSKKNDSAVVQFKTAIQIAEQHKLEREAGNALLGLANLYQFNGHTLNAAQYYVQAAKLLKNKGRKRDLIGIYQNLYTILNRLKQKNGALRNMLNAVKTGESRESDLVKLINTQSSEDEGFYFADQSLVKEVGANSIYVIFGNAKFAVTNSETLGSYGAIRDVQRIPTGTLASIPDFPRNGSIMREFNGDPKVYIVKDSLLYHIYSTEELEHYGGWDAVYFMPNGSLEKFPKATQQVTMENVNTIFDLKQEFDNLTDSIQIQLNENTRLSAQLSQEVAQRNNALQKRKIWLWASGIGLTALLIIIFLIIRNFRQKQKLHRQNLESLKKEEELQRKMAVEQERSRIASDIHDDLGAGLSTLRFLSEKVKQNSNGANADAEKIVANSNELVQKMNELIWAMNEQNDSLEDLLFYTRSYAVEYAEENGLNISFSLPKDIPAKTVSGEIRRNIFLTIKESLHNIVKHARAKNVTVTIYLKNEQLEINIADDGVGMNYSEQHAKGNGIRNMEKRMKASGGTIAVNGDPGTTIKLVVPI